MASIKTPKGRLHYKPVNIYLGIKQIDRGIAFENLKVVIRVLREVGIRVSPAYGTLLGIIRENNFIEWDEDIDLFILSEDKDKLLSALWTMRDEGLELVREARCGHLFSVMRKGEYIDFYIMDKISPEVRTGYGDLFMLEKHLTDLVDYDFRGLTISVPRQYEECLEFLYGDWRTPVKYANFEMSKAAIRKAQLRNDMKKWLPFDLRFYLLKKHHEKDLMKFLAKCERKGVRLHEDINYFKTIKMEHKKTILTFGVFDMLHLGHVALFKKLADYVRDTNGGGYVTVAVQDNDYILKYKPESRIVYSLEEKIFMLNSIRYIDKVVVYKDVDKDIQNIDFDILAVGPDQKHEGFQRAMAWSREHGKEVVVIPRTEGISSTQLKEDYLP
ncbi:MAG: LicD family protein [Bacteroidaceae bacterium]|nr:LicD family protein [Bacteroidaceae bacterium]